jgi:hypothetical protein
MAMGLSIMRRRRQNSDGRRWIRAMFSTQALVACQQSLDTKSEVDSYI